MTWPPPLKFTHTTESLWAIMHGMEPREDDYILAIAGSGDQALAMLERGCRVRAVDGNPNQLAYFERQISRIRREDEAFFKNTEVGAFEVRNHAMRVHLRHARIMYFTPQRLQAIKQNLDNLELVNGDIADEHGPFTKVYLSNIPDRSINVVCQTKAERIFMGCAMPTTEGLLRHNGFQRMIDIEEQLHAEQTRLHDHFFPRVYKKR